MKLAAYGITTVVSSGDDGCLGNLGKPAYDHLNNKELPDGIFDPQYPATSPWVLSVGATELVYDKQTNIKRRWGLHKDDPK